MREFGGRIQAAGRKGALPLIVASSLGAATACYKPDALLKRGCRRPCLEAAVSDQAGPGTFFVARHR